MANSLSNKRIVDPVLTNYARGYTNSQFIADKLFPIVSVSKEGGTIPVFGKEAFKIYSTHRALRADSNVISPEGITTETLQTEEYDISYPIDYRENKEAAWNLQQYGTRVVKDIIDLGREKTSVDLAQNATNYPTGNKITLSGTSQWSDSVNSKPIDDIKTGFEAIRSKIGRYPNVLALGAASYNALTESEQILGRIKYAEKGIVTVDMLKSILAVPDGTPLTIVVGLDVYATDEGTFTDIWSDNAILAYVSTLPGGIRTPYDPSFGYTFRRSGNPFVDRYMKSGNKIEYIRNTDNYQVKIVGSDAGYLIADTVA